MVHGCEIVMNMLVILAKDRNENIYCISANDTQFGMFPH